MSVACALASIAIAITSARGAGGAKVLADPRRTYDPATHRVGITLEISESSETFVVGAQGISTTYNAEFFCKKVCPRSAEYCYDRCTVGLYYTWDDSRARAGSGLYRDSWTYVQACTQDDDCSDPVYEEHLMCDADGGSGCPCWIFVRTDPSVSCDAPRP